MVATWLAVTVIVGAAALEEVEPAADDTTLEGPANGVEDATAPELEEAATASWMSKVYVLPVDGDKAVTATVTIVPAAERGGPAVMMVPEPVT